jgi:hypothetical protein
MDVPGYAGGLAERRGSPQRCPERGENFDEIWMEKHDFGVHRRKCSSFHYNL